MTKSINLLLGMSSLFAAVSLAGCAVVPYQTPAGWLFAGRSVGTACVPSCRQMPCHGYHATIWSAWPEWCPPSVESMLLPEETVGGAEESLPELVAPPPAEASELPQPAEPAEQTPPSPPAVESEPSSEAAPPSPPPVVSEPDSGDAAGGNDSSNPPPVIIDGDRSDTTPSDTPVTDEPELPEPPSADM